VAILIVAGLGLVAMAGLTVKSFLLHNRQFMLQSADNIQVNGNRVVTESQALSVFAPDVGHSIFHVPLADRKVQLEEIKWVRTAAVMRLWPNRLRVTIVERKPVAFALDGNTVRLVDDQGVLLDLPNAVAQHYSFPVLNGIAAADPLSIRTARIEMYLQFASALDAEGGHISSTLSQVDLSDPEDIRVVFLGGARQPLVHFGDANYLARYQAYQQHLTEWLQQYPALRSVDMRYGKQVVLDTGSVAPGSSAPLDASSTADDATQLSDATTTKQSNETSTPAMKPAKVAAKSVKRPVAARHKEKPHHGNKARHRSKTHARPSRHTPERGHTVRKPIMHVVSGM
jgi:cell division protein FtsQ